MSSGCRDWRSLHPAIVETICQGRQPAELNAETLINRIDLPLQWSAQLKALVGSA